MSSSALFSRVARATASAGIAALLCTTAMIPAGVITAQPVQAGVSLSISIGVNGFYDGLSPYGDWVDWGGRWVWVPNDVDPYWRPYTYGHWSYTQAYGWIWVSDEPFGWATYHYGRWGYSPEIGWFWVPGTRWAPAWVSWRRAPGYIAWAPLAPVGFGFDFGYEDEPSWYWQAVPDRAFLSINISRYVIHDYDRVDFIWQNSRPLGSVTVINNVTINNVINVNEVERVTQRRVVPYNVAPARSPDEAGHVRGREIAVFNPKVDAPHDAALPPPPKLRKLDDVARERSQDPRIGGGLPRGADRVVPDVHPQQNDGPPALADELPPPRRRNKDEPAPLQGQGQGQPEQQQTQQGSGKQRDPKVQPQDQGQPEIQMPEDQPQPQLKRRKQQQFQQPQDQGQPEIQMPEDQPQPQLKRRKQQQFQQPDGGDGLPPLDLQQPQRRQKQNDQMRLPDGGLPGASDPNQGQGRGLKKRPGINCNDPANAPLCQ